MTADVENCDAVIVQGNLDGNIKAKYIVIVKGEFNGAGVSFRLLLLLYYCTTLLSVFDAPPSLLIAAPWWAYYIYMSAELLDGYAFYIGYYILFITAVRYFIYPHQRAILLSKIFVHAS